MNCPRSKSILMTIDVEDWFQVENFKDYIPFSSWEHHELRVERNVHRLLDLFDSCWAGRTVSPAAFSDPEHSAKPQKKGDSGAMPQAVSTTKPGNPQNPRATFFVLGWLAQRLPQMVREIVARGHEVASHGHGHEMPAKQSPADLRRDLLKSKALLEDITGVEVFGYRAPSFSISPQILKIIEDCGYSYDSSYNSFDMHGRYGRIDLDEGTGGSTARQLGTGFFELPISNIRIGNTVIPWGGGGYFRLIPGPIFNSGVRMILKKQDAYIFYCHPWEIDPGQPRAAQASPIYRFRHYVNLSKTQAKLKSLLDGLGDCTFVSCRDYIQRG